jgi:Fe-S-cluster containining protein
MTVKLTIDDCRRCGACCVSLREQNAYCDASLEDLKKLDPRWVKENVAFASLMDALAMALDGGKMVLAALRTKWAYQRHGPCADMDLCTCIALRGSVMHRVSCRIYERRPTTCRETVNPGDSTCLEFRKALLEKVEGVG